MNALGYPQEKWPLPIELAQWPILDSIFASVSPRVFFSSSLKEIYFDDNLVNDALIDRYHGLANYPGNLDAFPKRVKAKLDTQPELIKGVTVPTLVMWGEEDIYFPVENAYRFQQDIPGASLKVYQNVGHLPMEEIPQKSVTDYRAFVESLVSGA
jgi:pimeloyl-ACP methyl ester carboxylesterase